MTTYFGELKTRITHDYSTDARIMFSRFTGLGLKYLKFVWVEVEKGSMLIEPVIKSDYIDGDTPNTETIVQSILDAAWEAGMRPKGFKDFKEENNATINHLNDMRRIVFKDRFKAIKSSEK